MNHKFKQACINNDINLVKDLLKTKNFRSKININQRHNILTEVCISSNNFELAKILLKDNKFDAKKYDYIIFKKLIEDNKLEMFKIVYENTLNINIKTEHYILFNSAIYFNKLDIFKFLLQQNDTIINDMLSVVEYAVIRSNKIMISEFINHKYLNVEFLKYILILIIDKPEFTDIVKKILDLNKIDISYNNNILLKRSCRNFSNIQTIKLILSDKKVDPGTNNYEIIKGLLLFGHTHTELVKLFIYDKRLDLSFDRNFIIRRLILNNQIELARYVINDKRVRKKLTKSITKDLINNKIIPYYKSRSQALVL